MSQSSGRTCPACGTNVPAGQRFCSNCGTDLEVSRPASQYGGTPPQNIPQAPPVPPYAQSSYGQQQQQQYQQYQQPQQKSHPIAEALGALGLLFLLRRYRPGYQARRQSSGCCGCLVTLFILLIIIGIPAYVVYRNDPQVFQQIQQNFKSGNTGHTPTASPTILATVSINQSVKYAGVDFTIESAQQATSFTDDTVPSTANGVVRVKYKEANNSGQDVVYFAGQIDHLILPDKSSVDPLNSLQGGGISNAGRRPNWVDFAVPTSDKIAQLTLVLGTSQDAQISIPLTGQAVSSAFLDKKVTLNTPISYNSLNYTLQSATRSLSIPGKQASPGMHYVILSFNVDNPTSNDKAYCSPQDYMRLMAGGVTNPPVYYTLPCGTNANTSGKIGVVAFLMPDNNSAYTLIFLAASGYSTVPVNTNFTIQ